MNVKNFSLITIFLPLLTILFYYNGYLWNYKYLTYHGLRPTGIIGFEDIIFNYADITRYILVTLSYGFLSLCILMIFLSKSMYHDPGMSGNVTFLEVVNKFREIWEYFKSKKYGYINLAILTLSVIMVAYLYFSSIPIKEQYYKMAVIFTIMIIVLPALFFIYPLKRSLILFIFMLGLFASSSILIDDLIKKASEHREGEHTVLSFVYKGQKRETSETLQLLFTGYRYIILKDISNCKFEFYERANVTDIVMEY